jgi:hypothetical protein
MPQAPIVFTPRPTTPRMDHLESGKVRHVHMCTWGLHEASLGGSLFTRFMQSVSRVRAVDKSGAPVFTRASSTQLCQLAVHYGDCTMRTDE